MPNGFNWRTRANLGLSVILAQGFHGGAACPIVGEQTAHYGFLLGAVTHDARPAAFMGLDQVVGGVGQHFASLMRCHCELHG